MDANERIRRTFEDVLLPILKVMISKFPTPYAPVRGYVLEVSHRVWGRVLGVPFPTTENVALALSRDADCTTTSPEPLSPSPSCRGIATPGTSPGLRACLWSWPGVHLECRLQVLVPEHFLHQLRINLHLDQDRSERPPESVKSEGAQRGHDFRLVCGHAQVIGDQHVGRRPLPAFEANCAIDALAPLCPIR